MDGVTELHRRDLTTGDDEVIADRCYYFMVATELGIFGMSANTEMLELLSPDGLISTIVASETGPFCVAGNWVFYQEGGDGGPLRMVKTDGSSDQPVPTR